MKKIILLGLTTLAMALGGLGAAKYINNKPEELDAQIIVQLKGDVSKKSHEAIIQEQNAVISQIHEITTSYKVTDRFTNLVNAFTISVNAGRVSAIENLPDVQHVDYNHMHSITYQENDLDVLKKVIVDAERDNISKGTMEVPDDTNEGEGVFIAILDTGYLLNGETYDETGKVAETGVTHKAYTALADGVKLHDTEESINTKTKTKKQILFFIFFHSLLLHFRLSSF